MNSSSISLDTTAHLPPQELFNHPLLNRRSMNWSAFGVALLCSLLFGSTFDLVIGVNGLIAIPYSMCWAVALSLASAYCSGLFIWGHKGVPVFIEREFIKILYKGYVRALPEGDLIVLEDSRTTRLASNGKETVTGDKIYLR